MPPPVIEKVFVDFIRYDEQIVPARKIRQRLNLRSAEYLPRWVARRINDDGLGLGRDRLFELSRVERPFRGPHLHNHRHRLDCAQGTGVVLIVGFEEDDFVTGIQ